MSQNNATNNTREFNAKDQEYNIEGYSFVDNDIVRVIDDNLSERVQLYLDTDHLPDNYIILEKEDVINLAMHFKLTASDLECGE